MARRFVLRDKPVHGFSVEGVVVGWPLPRVLLEGRVRARSFYATCRVAEMHRLGADVLATFGVDPPHFTVRIERKEQLSAVADLLSTRVRANPKWQDRR